MISMEQARALGAHLAAQHGATILHPDDPIPAAVRTALEAAGELSPVVAPAARAILSHLDRVSTTLPGGPLPTLILLSPAAVATPEGYARTVAHEAQHAVQIAEAGDVQISVDYLLAPSLRARAEADAYAVGLCVEWLLTGVLPTLDGPLASLSGGTYHLDAPDVLLAGGLLDVHLDAMRGGLLPPLTVAVETYRWLRTHAPEALRVTLAREPA